MAMYLKADGSWTSKRSEGVQFASNQDAIDAALRLQTGEAVASVLAPQHCGYCLVMRDLSSAPLRADGTCPICERLGR